MSCPRARVRSPRAAGVRVPSCARALLSSHRQAGEPGHPNDRDPRGPDARPAPRGSPDRLRLGDPHLYSFWISGKFWDDTGEYTSPVDKDEALEPKDTADVPIGKLGLRKGRSIAYVFDFGDEWRVLLKVVDRWEAGDESYPMLVEAEGVPPPQYAEIDDEPEEE